MVFLFRFIINFHYIMRIEMAKKLHLDFYH